MKKSKIPDHLSFESRKFFKQIVEQYEISDEGGLKILRVALEALDRAQACRVQIDREGLTQVDRFGVKKPHPLINAERDSRSAFLAGLKALNLDLEPLRDKPGRPGGK